MSFIEQVVPLFAGLQQRVCSMLEQAENAGKFSETAWSHPQGGGGNTRILEEGEVLERSGVNFSHVKGPALVPAATVRHPELVNCPFEASGVSVVIHPRNPHVPSMHANFRYIEVMRQDSSFHGWFGGGFDMTPFYGVREDCMLWHSEAKAACDPFGADVYPRFKKACDDYFYLKHRGEPRGIGGIFFDDLQEWGFEKTFAFVQAAASRFTGACQTILARRKQQPYGQRERDFQCYRRGRYAEFNLLQDRGTRFGLEFGGRTESILMSLPPVVNWKHDWHPEPGTPEAELYDIFLKGKW